MKKRISILIGLLVIVALGCWINSRWNTWFHNPEEHPYKVSKVPTRILLTFGNNGEYTRMVSWMCDTAVDKKARLILVTPQNDTINIPAEGEVFESRAGKAAYYRAQIKANLLYPHRKHRYCVETNGAKSSWYEFTCTNPASDSFAFLFMGDVQDSINGIANKLLKQAIQHHPEIEFVAFGGDLTERPTDEYWAETFRSIDSVCTAMPIVCITGNHDYLKGVIKKCERRFSLVFPYYLKGMEERNDENHLYHMKYHNTDFYLIDSDREFFYLWSQKKWLEEQFANTSCPHRIVLLHHPLYSIKKKNNNLIQRWMFNDMIRNANVDLVLQGHEHAYAHCTSNEEPLKSNICTTPPLYTVSHCSPKNYKIKPSERFYPVIKDTRCYQIIKVKGETMTMLAYNAATHEMIDSVEIKK